MSKRALLSLLAVLLVVVVLTNGSDDSPPSGDAGRSAQSERPSGTRPTGDPGRASRDHRRQPNRQRTVRPQRPKPPRARARPAAVPADARRSRITDVTDGDTVEIAGLGPSRLIGVDTPEVYFGAECYGRAASTFTAGRLRPGRAVYFRRGVEPTDRYGRALVYLWLPDGTFFNALLVRKGFAVPLTIPPNAGFADRFVRLARLARTAARGLWSPSTCRGDPDRPAGR